MDDAIEDVRRRARERTADVAGMLLDGDAIEQLARAHERHADRLDGARRELSDVGGTNHLGDTSEGRTVTANYRASTVTGEYSLSASILQQASISRQIASQLRDTGRAIRGADDEGERSIVT